MTIEEKRAKLKELLDELATDKDALLIVCDWVDENELHCILR